MKTVGFPISHKENERRRAIVPEDVAKLSHSENVYVEMGYGEVLDLDDGAYEAVGCTVCPRTEVLGQDIICDPKVGDAEYLGQLHAGQIIFGWVHATQNRNITDAIVDGGLTAYAWEKMFEGGRHVFWKNNELAGKAAVINAFQCWGRLPIGCKVAVIGYGNTARGACAMLNMLGAEVVQYNRLMEDLLRKEIDEYDVIVNCVLWDVTRDDHIIYMSDLNRMKHGSMIIDVSCDRNGGIESCVPTTIENPVYMTRGVLHYAVDHTPSFFYKTFSYENSDVISPYIEQLMNDKPEQVLRNCCIIRNGEILDEEIYKYQKRTLV